MTDNFMIRPAEIISAHSFSTGLSHRIQPGLPNQGQPGEALSRSLDCLRKKERSSHQESERYTSPEVQERPITASCFASCPLRYQSQTHCRVVLRRRHAQGHVDSDDIHMFLEEDMPQLDLINSDGLQENRNVFEKSLITD
eukprot:768793-Hanusia_phi.AAC.2